MDILNYSEFVEKFNLNATSLSSLLSDKNNWNYSNLSVNGLHPSILNLNSPLILLDFPIDKVIDKILDINYQVSLNGDILEEFNSTFYPQSSPYFIAFNSPIPYQLKLKFKEARSVGNIKLRIFKGTNNNSIERPNDLANINQSLQDLLSEYIYQSGNRNSIEVLPLRINFILPESPNDTPVYKLNASSIPCRLMINNLSDHYIYISFFGSGKMPKIDRSPSLSIPSKGIYESNSNNSNGIIAYSLVDSTENLQGLITITRIFT